MSQTDIFSGALFIQVSLGWDLYLSTGVLLLITAAYTVAGWTSSLRRLESNIEVVEIHPVTHLCLMLSQVD